MKTVYVTFYGSISSMVFVDDADAQAAYEKIRDALVKYKAFSRNECADTVEVSDASGNPAAFRLERMDAVMISAPPTEAEVRAIVEQEAVQRKIYEEIGVPYPDRKR